jgi:hypothetical protein
MIKKINFYSSLLFSTGLLFLFITGCKKDEETQVTDIDGNVYNMITLFDQVWLGEDLKTTKYNDGTPIPNITDNSAWSNLNTPGYCWYNNDIYYKLNIELCILDINISRKWSIYMSMSEIKPNIEEMEQNSDIEGLISALTFNDCITRKEAVIALKKIADIIALFPLIEALKYEPWQDKYAVMGSVR